MEAAWLLAVLITPVFFNVYSSRIFEPDKITLLRSLALVVLAAWIVKLVEEGGPRWETVASSQGGFRGRLKVLMRTPLIGLVLALAVVYLLATIFSVTPYTSFWGSYQRLQGSYTTLSYLILFGALVANLRHRAQVQRLIIVAILSSLPVSLYGILQRYRADPIPWGGDVTVRIAANMGNSIFVAAYLVMVFPLTAMRLIESFEALLQDRGPALANFARATGFTFIAALQAIALYFSGSRGPWLGWGASLVLLWLGLSLIWRKRWMTMEGVILAFAAGAFLVTLNIPGGPLESLRNRPEFGRLGQLLDAESRTGRVRTLIWQGAAELVQPHEPLEYPDGRKDIFNFLRPLIGYGPESMYVAYNRFYQPELTQVEKRNASPDRSHNETWDSLVITGLLGLIVYLALFGSVVYYGLKWLGLVSSPVQRNFFLALYLSGGVLATAVFWAWKGVAYLGVALPFGMIFGVLVYLIVAALTTHSTSEVTGDDRLRAYLLLGLVGAITAHYVEINFGIAIAATRVYFWVFTALILLVGWILPRRGEYRLALETNREKGGLSSSEAMPSSGMQVDRSTEIRGGAISTSARRKQRRAAARPTAQGYLIPGWLRWALIASTLVAVLLMTLGFEFISNASRSPNALTLIGNSLTSLSNGGASFGLVALLFTTWLIGGVLLISEHYRENQTGANSSEDRSTDQSVWLKMTTVTLVGSAALAFLFWLWHAEGLATLNRVNADTIAVVLAQVRRSENILTRYYVYLFILLLGLAGLLQNGGSLIRFRWPSASLAIATGLFLLAIVLSSVTNLRVIQADIAFKTGEVFARPGSWPVAIEIYKRARDLAPNEDYYYLFLGRAYLEHAKTIQDEQERESLIAAAAEDLKEAQRINPLNTDHTANLARLYSLWSTFPNDPVEQATHASLADEYFARAVSLSPKNARLWGEWAAHTMNNLHDPQTAYQRLQQALAIDPYYDWTYGLIGDYYGRFISKDPNSSEGEKEEALIQAAEYYTRALSLAEPDNIGLSYGYLVSYAGVQTQLGNLPQSILAYERAVQLWPDNPDRWRIEAALAQLYAQIGDLQTALRYAQSALAITPQDQRATVEELVRQYGGQP